jgi:phosphohistidine swiveling domain-containing protein
MKWKFIVKRDISPLFYYFITEGQIRKEAKRFLGIDFGFDHYLGGPVGVFYSEEELEEADEFAKKEYSKHGNIFLKSLLEKWQSFMKELEKFAFEISKKDYSGKTNEELLKEFEKLQDKYHKLSTGLYLPVIIEKLADDIIKKKLPKEKAEEYFAVLTTPEKDNEGTRELKSMLEMAVKLEKGKDISEDIKNHIKEFGWINTRGFIGNEWTEKEIMERVKTTRDHRLADLKEHAQKIRQATEKILKELNVDKNFREFVAITKGYILYRTERMDSFVKAGFMAKPLFNEIAKRLKLDFQDIIYLMPDEIKDALKTGKDYSKKIKERKKDFIFIRTGEKSINLTGKELENYKEKHLKEKIKTDITEIKGTMASQGKARGIVKVLAGKHELSKINKGDILVASMTTPDFVPAMEKAAAFVTDEGGILCHAAIVSREMNKPCIIGTGIATKVLKDGDFVEVNADKGIIRILKRK